METRIYIFFLSITMLMELFHPVLLLQKHSLFLSVFFPKAVFLSWWLETPWDMKSEKAIRWVLKILLQTKTNKFLLFQSLHIIFFQGQKIFFLITCNTNTCIYTK